MIDVEKMNFKKLNGLIPAIIIDDSNNNVLMLGYMNEEAVRQTLEKGKVVFYSRTRQKLWMKGETSGNYLNVVSIKPDCDNDTLLIYTNPDGPACHTGAYSCFSNKTKQNISFMENLFDLVKRRKLEMPANSYTANLFRLGSDRIIQKVGEEAVETVIAAKNRNKKEVINETSDLIFHLFILLADQNIEIADVVENLQKRNKKTRGNKTKN